MNSIRYCGSPICVGLPSATTYCNPASLQSASALPVAIIPPTCPPASSGHAVNELTRSSPRAGSQRGADLHMACALVTKRHLTYSTALSPIVLWLIQ
ncbi:hypothetical protein B0T17DRAFT_528067 [Bombardia bombarda]|uniref:Uncharacterized protein n=1 Tax=Bombardia bombarda TaxID=252184 RepID=A0AA39XAD6_9PEZI|nr:hypothetical protein B0T17DRAFT_528067 [Bombardia bombarda]